MNFYTYARHYGDKILVRGIKNGKRFQYRDDFRPTLFVPSDKPSDYKTIYGDSVSPMQFETNKEATNFFDRYRMFLTFLYLDKITMLTNILLRNILVIYNGTLVKWQSILLILKQHQKVDFLM